MSPDSSLAALPRPITVSGLGDPATLRAQLDTAAQGADRQAVHSTASQQQLEEAFVMQTSAGGRSDSIDEWDPLITSYHTKAAPAISVTAVASTLPTPTIPAAAAAATLSDPTISATAAAAAEAALNISATTVTSYHTWAVQASGTGLIRAFSIAYDGGGGALVTGSFSGTALFGTRSLTSRGSSDAFVIHVTASGAIGWAINVGGTSDDQGSSIADDGAGGALVTGHFTDEALFGTTSLTSNATFDAFVMHVTASGAIDWIVQAGSESFGSQGTGVSNDGVGGALVTGSFRGHTRFGSTLLISPNGFDAFVMHVRASGTIDWAVQAGDDTPSSFQSPGIPDVRGSGIAHDGAGGALVTGYFSGKASFGSTSLTFRGKYDAFVMHVTASGAIDWAVQAGGELFDSAEGVADDGVGGALVTGYFGGTASFGSTSLTSQGSSDAFVMHVTASGDVDWVIQAGGTSGDYGAGIAHDGACGAFVTGSFSDNASFSLTSLTSSGYSDAFVMHVTAAGAIHWTVQASATYNARGFGVAYNGAGGALVTGDFQGIASFGSRTLTSLGNDASCFAALLIPPPDLPMPPPPWPPPAPAQMLPWYPSLPVVVAIVTSTLALVLGLLLACCYRRQRRQRRLGDNIRVSRDRAQFDLQLLEHRFKRSRSQLVYLVEDSHRRPPSPPSESPLPVPREEGQEEGGPGGGAPGGGAAGAAAPAAAAVSETDAALAAGVGFQPEGERLTGDVGAQLTRGLQAQARKQHERRARKEKEQTRKAEKEAARHAVGSSSAYSSHAAPEPHQVDPLPVLYLLRPGQL
jgi:hypothetical protein